MGSEFKFLLGTLGKCAIVHKLTCSNISGKNGVVEYRHKRIFERGLALLSKEGMPLLYWPYAMRYVVYLLNHLPTKILYGLSPFELLFNTPSIYEYLKALGCQYFPCLHAYNKHKLESRSLACIFLNYCSNQRGYLCIYFATSKVYYGRHVVFNECNFSFLIFSSSVSNPTCDSPTHIIVPTGFFYWIAHLF